jgi:hypothetical protein
MCRDSIPFKAYVPVNAILRAVALSYSTSGSLVEYTMVLLVAYLESGSA